MKKHFKVLTSTIVSIAIIFSMFSVLSVISIFGFAKVLDYVELFEPVSSTHVVNVSKDNEGYTTIINQTNDEPLKILQITDMHICCSLATYGKDCSAFDAVYQLIKKNNPDLIVVTGDMLYPFMFTLSSNNRLQAQAVGNFFENVGIYWTFVFGNHDGHGAFITASKLQLCEYFSGLENCLFERGDIKIDGYGNYIIKAQNFDGTLNKVLIFMDSNDYISGINNFDKIHDNQVDWYKSQIQQIATYEGVLTSDIYSVLFIHIPITAYKTAVDLYLEESDEVQFEFGELGEYPCTPDLQEDFFSTILELNSTKAIFCGHDHLNTFCIKYQDVLLTYGMSIDFTAYLGIHKINAQRGGTIIFLNELDEISIFQAPQTNNFEQALTGYNY